MTKRVKRRMVGVVDRGAHADLCQYEFCIDQGDVETSEINIVLQ